MFENRYLLLGLSIKGLFELLANYNLELIVFLQKFQSIALLVACVNVLLIIGSDRSRRSR